MDHPKFVIEASKAKSMAKSSGSTVKQLLPSLVESAQTLARTPISNFHVGAIGVGPSGRIFFGVNLEFPGLPLHHSVHAEQFLVTNLFLNGETNLDYLAVSAAPCGHCRQFLQEIRGAPDIKILITSDEEQDFTPLCKFLSYRFGPHDLLPDDTPLLLDPRHYGLSFSGEINNSSAAVCNSSENGESKTEMKQKPKAKLKFATSFVHVYATSA